MSSKRSRKQDKVERALRVALGEKHPEVLSESVAPVVKASNAQLEAFSLEQLRNRVKELEVKLQNSQRDVQNLQYKLRTVDDIQTLEEEEEFRMKFMRYLRTSFDPSAGYGYVSNTYTPAYLSKLALTHPKTVDTIKCLLRQYCQSIGRPVHFLIWEGKDPALTAPEVVQV